MSAPRSCARIVLLLWWVCAPALADTATPTYDPNGNLTSRATAAGTTDYTYDALDRLKTEFGPGVDQSFGYDGNGNRLSDGTHIYTLAPNGNRIQTVNGVTRVYDAAGNLLDDGQGKTYAYNAAGRLKEVRVNNVLVSSYKYNYRGLRTHKITPQGTTLYHYDTQGHLIQASDPLGVPKQSLHWADDQPIAQVDHTGPTDQLVYLHTDHLNTPRTATDEDGTVVWRWEGGAFGDTPPNEDPDGDGNLTKVDLRFAGQYFDSETGLHYWGARYYDPKTGRGIQPDRMSVAEHVARWQANMDSPVRLPLEINPYAYVANNPLKWIDPTGEDILCGNGFTSIVDPNTKVVKCVPTNQKEPPQCLYGECAHVLPKTTNTQCMITCMAQSAPILAKAACKLAKDPAGGVVAKKACEEYIKGISCSAKCDKEIPDLCPTKK